MSTTPDHPATEASADRLMQEALAKSGLVWIGPDRERARPVWHVVQDGAVLVLGGPGEQQLPPLPDRVVLLARAKDSRALLVRAEADARRVTADDPRWQEYAGAVASARLNAGALSDELVRRWSDERWSLWELRPDDTTAARAGSDDEVARSPLRPPASRGTAD